VAPMAFSVFILWQHIAKSTLFLLCSLSALSSPIRGALI